MTSERRKQVVEAAGGVCIVAGVAMVSVAAALLLLGLGLVLWANFGDEEGSDASVE